MTDNQYGIMAHRGSALPALVDDAHILRPDFMYEAEAENSASRLVSVSGFRGLRRFCDPTKTMIW